MKKTIILSEFALVLSSSRRFEAARLYPCRYATSSLMKNAAGCGALKGHGFSRAVSRS